MVARAEMVSGWGVLRTWSVPAGYCEAVYVNSICSPMETFPPDRTLEHAVTPGVVGA